MEKATIFVIVFTLVVTLFLIGIPLITAGQNYVSTVPWFTKAICDQNNRCEDYELFCNNTDLIALRTTGFTAQFSPEWQDPRTDKQKEISC